MLNPIQLLFDERGMRSYRRALGQVFSRIRGRTPLLVEIQLEVIPMNPQGPSAPYLPSNGLEFERLFCGDGVSNVVEGGW